MLVGKVIKLKKIIVIGVIALFIIVGFQPAFATEPIKSTDITNEDIEPKDYLFETIIEISNNPEVKELFEEYGNNIYDLVYDYRGIFIQILFNNPSLLFSKLFTKPKITSDYLNSFFNEGCEIVDIIGEDKALEMIKSVKLPNPDIVDELQNIVLNDEELSNRITTLAELNDELKPDKPFWDNPIICSFLMLSAVPIYCFFILLGLLAESLEGNPILYWSLAIIAGSLGSLLLIYLYLGIKFDCANFYHNNIEIKQLIPNGFMTGS
jgi:hypothetical protein